MEITKLSLNVKDKTITISAAATDLSYIESIYIDTHKSFICSSEHSQIASEVYIDPSDKGVTLNNEDKIESLTDYVIYLENIADGAASILDLNNDMLFIFVKGPTEEIASVIFDQNALYQRVFKGIHKNIVSNCKIQQKAVELSLLFEAFLLSWSTADPRKFIYYWNKLHVNESLISNCSCND